MNLSAAYQYQLLNTLYRDVAVGTNGGLQAPPATLYVSLHTADPGQHGGSEVAAGNYARASVAAATIFNANPAVIGTESQLTNGGGAITFAAPGATAWGTVTYFGIWAAGATTLNGAITNSATSMVVTAATQFPGSGNYYAVLEAGTANEEVVQVTAGQGTTTWTIVRNCLGTTGPAGGHATGVAVSGLLICSAPLAPVTTLSAAATNIATSISVTSAAGFPSSGNYEILVDSGSGNLEHMTVTAGQGTTTWTVTRDNNNGVAHNSGVSVIGPVTSQTIGANAQAPSFATSALVIQAQ